jgi:hypothetical protein
MRIEIDAQVIAGASQKESVIGFDLQGGELIQKSMPLRGTRPNWFTRGLESYNISFQVCRIHEGIAQAAKFVFSHTSLRKSGTIHISEEYDGKAIEMWSVGVLMQIGTPKIVGMTTYTAYRLECGPFSERNPST